MSAAVHGVLFDFGGTLFAHDSLADTIGAAADRLHASWGAAETNDLAAHIDGLAMDPVELAKGRDLDPLVWEARWREIYAVADHRLAGLGAEIYRLMHDPAQWCPFTATASTLHGLAESGVAVGVVSNTGWDVRRVFRHWGVDASIETFVLSCEVGLVKPDPAIFALACARLGLAVSSVLMVGDDPVADAGAARAGLRTLLLPNRGRDADNGLAMVGGLVSA